VAQPKSHIHCPKISITNPAQPASEIPAFSRKAAKLEQDAGVMLLMFGASVLLLLVNAASIQWGSGGFYVLKAFLGRSSNCN
jgi:hypothetical protein